MYSMYTGIPTLSLWTICIKSHFVETFQMNLYKKCHNKKFEFLF